MIPALPATYAARLAVAFSPAIEAMFTIAPPPLASMAGIWNFRVRRNGRLDFGQAVARRITRPVAKLIAVTRAMTAGDRSARAGPVRAPAELRELAAAFDQMANTLDRQEQIAATWSLPSPMSCGPRSRCCR